MKRTKKTWKWKALCTFISCLLLTLQMSAQSTAATISGTVTSKTTGNPVEGATVVVKGTKRSAITNSTGHFTISAAPGETLVISYVGYANVETKVGIDNNISISLSENYGNLSDVVVVGYGKARKVNLTTAQTTVSAKEIEKTVNTTVEQAIQGRAAGVYVTQNSGQPGGGISVTIRGISSLTATQPLYVIDGVQIQQSSDVSYGTSSTANPLSGLNPSDIEDIQILQGPSAT